MLTNALCALVSEVLMNITYAEGHGRDPLGPSHQGCSRDVLEVQISARGELLP